MNDSPTIPQGDEPEAVDLSTPRERWKRLGEIVLTPIFMIYFPVAGVSIAYEEWVFANNNGFIATVFLGTIVSAFKGMLWPVFMSIRYFG